MAERIDLEKLKEMNRLWRLLRRRQNARVKKLMLQGYTCEYCRSTRDDDCVSYRKKHPEHQLCPLFIRKEEWNTP